MTPQPADIVWSGQHVFRISGSDLHQDTLRIESNYWNLSIETPLRLVLPTLCITYADMQFANAIGGKQDNYPDSRAYGQAHFDPPIEIKGNEEVEKFTWIRGAHRVNIGPETTEIDWFIHKTLVIPRLRIGSKIPAVATLSATNMPIAVDPPLRIDVSHFADGRPVGGLRIEKRHPQWVPTPARQDYELWVWVIDGETLEPIAEAALNLLRWDPTLPNPYGMGGFRKIDEVYADGDGIVHLQNLPCDQLEAVTLQRPGWRAIARCFRPLPGEEVQFHLFAWKLQADIIRYTWNPGDTLGGIALLTGHAPEDILRRNALFDATSLKAGISIDLPCYAAIYRLEPGDRLEWLAATFSYSGPEELASLNGVSHSSLLETGRAIQLPGWYFFYARGGESLENLDRQFGLNPGWSRPVGRVYHPDHRIAYESETIAIPTKEFVSTHSIIRPT